MKYKASFYVLAFAMLTACGGSGSSNGPDIKKEPEPLQVTGDNISQAITVSGASETDITSQQVPAELKEINTSNVESVVVSANSSFTAELSVPAEEVPAGKKVAGYLIELSEGEFSFIPAASNTVTALNKGIMFDEKNTPIVKKIKQGLKFKSPPENKSISVLAVESIAEGSTDVVLEGWGNSEFTLEQSLEGLKLRIYPLLVNDSVIGLISLSDIDLTDETNWAGVQELLLSVEAVATAQIQVSLTWNSKTDIDLWIVGPDGEKIYYAEPFSTVSLGWLDYDNTEAYGPENITFNYQMPEGDYKVYVHHYDGDVQTDYQVTIAIGNEVITYSGDFPEGVTYSEAIDDEGVDYISTFSIDDAKNEQLTTPVPINQFLGTWKLPEKSSVEGFIVMSEEGITAYGVNGSSCYGHVIYEGSSLPTGFGVENGMLQVSDAFVGGLYFSSEEARFTYAILDLQLSSLPENCNITNYDDFED